MFILNLSCHITSRNPVYSDVFAQPRRSLFLDLDASRSGQGFKVAAKKKCAEWHPSHSRRDEIEPHLGLKIKKKQCCSAKRKTFAGPSSCPDGALWGQSLPMRSRDLNPCVVGSNRRNKVILISGIITIVSYQFCIEQSASESDGTFCSCHW